LHGHWLVHEACPQLRGQAGNRQVAGRHEVAVAAAGGGPIAGCMLLTRRRSVRLRIGAFSADCADHSQ